MLETIQQFPAAEIDICSSLVYLSKFNRPASCLHTYACTKLTTTCTRQQIFFLFIVYLPVYASLFASTL